VSQQQPLRLEEVDAPDAAWPVSVRFRRAMLWVGSGFTEQVMVDNPGADIREALETILLHPWAAVFVDTDDLPLDLIRDGNAEIDGHPLRLYTESPSTDPPQNRVPVYALPQVGATDLGGVSKAAKTLNRLQMLQRAPVDAEVFVVGLSRQRDVVALGEARELSNAFRTLVVVGPTIPAPLELRGVDSVRYWRASLQAYGTLLESVGTTGADAEDLLVRVRKQGTDFSIRLDTCVDKSNPITQRFETISLRNLLNDAVPTLDDLRSFLSNPSGSWRPYASGIPFPRHLTYRRSVLTQIARFSRDGAAATETIWLQAEDGSGATTTVRQIAFDLANMGYPVLLARPDAEEFDFHQLSAFLTRAGDRFAAEGVSSSEAPWILVFDAQHTQLNWEFVTGVAGGLKRLQRAALVLAVRPHQERSDNARRSALGANRFLEPTLRNSIGFEDAAELGEHFARMLPAELRRARRDWERLVADTVRVTPEGSRSLFWVALRFWLLRVPGTEESLHDWLRSHLDAITTGRTALHAALLEVAALSRYRLEMPRELMLQEAVAHVREVAADDANLLGLVSVRRTATSAFVMVHSLTAEEFLRLSAKDDSALAAVGMSECINAFDLELHMLERVITREQISTHVGTRVVEELVTSALRVDPREAPRNYQERSRIVSMLERVPDQVWDNSQVFNHHIAKARRHLAVDPPDGSWNAEAIGEQLALAENHLLDAIDNIQPEEESRRESPLNLKVSLALTYDARAKHELRMGNTDESERFRSNAEKAYRQAQWIDSDNSYVLENFARFKLYQQAMLPAGDDRVRLIVDAIGLLEWELQADQSGRREEPILFELANAYEALEAGEGRALLARLAAEGTEAALVALSKLATRIDSPGQLPDDESMAEAERLLRKVPRDVASARTLFSLYRIISRRRPFDFVERLEVLVALEGDPDFAMPLQILMEFGILLFQVGGPIQRKRGEAVFRELREHLGDRSGALNVPDELRFLSDPRLGFKGKLQTSVVVKNVADGGRSYFGVPFGWGAVAIPMRVHDFGPNFGPQAVPPTLE
jgi:hypothetical protein